MGPKNGENLMKQGVKYLQLISAIWTKSCPRKPSMNWFYGFQQIVIRAVNYLPNHLYSVRL